MFGFLCWNVWCFISVLLYATPGDFTWGTCVTCWIVRLTTISLWIRYRLGPWILAKLAGRVRVQSVSLRSIRGIYYKSGPQTWHVDRIGWSHRSKGDDDASRWTIRMEGVTLDIGEALKDTLPAPKARRRRMTLADISPSPIGRRIWSLSSSAYSMVDPVLRPIIRQFFVSIFRSIIRVLPALSQLFNFELVSATVRFTAAPGTYFLADEALLHTEVSFTHLETATERRDRTARPNASRKAKILSMAAWKARVGQSFGRTWHRAWGKSRGSLSFSFSVRNIRGITEAGALPSNHATNVIFHLPGALRFTGAGSFNPKRAKLDAHSVDLALQVDAVSVNAFAAHSLLEKLRSPKTANLSPAATSGSESTTSPTSPTSPASPYSPMTPMTPWMESLTSPTSSSSRNVNPSRISRSRKPVAVLYPLKKVEIQLSAITFHHARRQFTQRRYHHSIVVRSMSLGINLSDPSSDVMHKEVMGSTPADDNLTPDVYAVTFSLQRLALNRIEEGGNRHNLCLTALSSLDVHVVVSGWPRPWLAQPLFLRGDPNASVLAVQIRLGDLDFTERMSHILALLEQSTSAPTKAEPYYALPPTLQPVPRLHLDIQSGNISAKLLCDHIPGQASSESISVQTNGFTLSGQSRFDVRPLGSFPPPRGIDRLPLLMNFDSLFFMNPVFVRVGNQNHSFQDGHRFSKVNMSDSNVWGEGLISIEATSVALKGIVQGDIDDDAGSAATLDSSSIFLDLQCLTESISVELWHRQVITVLARVTGALLSGQGAADRPGHSPPFVGLPIGLTSSVVVARFATLVTGRDINPNDDQDLSRGVAFRTGARVHFCSVGLSHRPYFRRLFTRSQDRHKLYLSDDRMDEAVAAASPRSVNPGTSAFLGLSAWNTVFRSAASTQYFPDDRYMAEERGDVPAHKAQEFLRIRSLKADVDVFSSEPNKRYSVDGGSKCQITVDVPEVQGTFRIAHAYNILHAIHALKNLISWRPRASRSTSRAIALWIIKCTVKTIQVSGILPKERFVTRLDFVNLEFSPADGLVARVANAFVWVPLQSHGNRWNDDDKERWEELARLQHLCILPGATLEGSPSIRIDGDGARLRVPCGYILAELILDLNLSVKAVRHISRMAHASTYFPVPSPSPESPKRVPHLSLRLRNLSVEAADDPFESNLGSIWKAGLVAAKLRYDREEAFHLKVAAIDAASRRSPLERPQPLHSDYHFGPKHSVSIEEAQERLSQLHAVDWILRHRKVVEGKRDMEETVSRRVFGSNHTAGRAAVMPNLVKVVAETDTPALLRAAFQNVDLTISRPSFSLEDLADWLYTNGSGLPRTTEFSLLLPMHLRFTLSSARITVRDYPIPLLDIPINMDRSKASWECETDLVIAEEMCDSKSVDWIDCKVLDIPDAATPGRGLSLQIPKTMTPVKSYAHPDVKITSDGITGLSWSVSYGPAIQDIMRVIDSLTMPPRDSSPGLGFWDKMRLVFHWKFRIFFQNEVRLYVKGTRDPYNVGGEGAGFALCWRGEPRLIIGHPNDDKELFQVISEETMIIIPDFETSDGLDAGPSDDVSKANRWFRHGTKKTCAKFSSGVRFGVGFVLERSCGLECHSCSHSAFHRDCRRFEFRPHYDVHLENKSSPPLLKSSDDSFNGFRSDFIHLSISLASSVRNTSAPEMRQRPSSFHLTPRGFAHFWSWWALFDGILSLPIRQGTYYPLRNISPKFGRHLATIKYRISVPQLFITHAYMDNSRLSWSDGVTPFVGVKALISHFKADLHQRDQETIVPGAEPDTVKVTRHKPFYAVEVNLKELDLRALLAIFNEPLKQSVPMNAPEDDSDYRTRHDLPETDSSSPWIDLDDFVECDWSSSAKPAVHLLPAASCPHFTYFRRNTTSMPGGIQSSKFGDENTHTCLLGAESSVPRVQHQLAVSRAIELRGLLQRQGQHRINASDEASTKKMLSLLEDYVSHLEEVEDTSSSADSRSEAYYMPSETVGSTEWAEFENVYQVHCPKIFVTNAVRDVMMQYYNCSRDRRGMEYHMATRAVKFIRDEAQAALATDQERSGKKSKGAAANSAQAAAAALRRMLGGDLGLKVAADSHEPTVPNDPGVVEPLKGWSDGVSLRKSHFCLLLNPQVILRHEGDTDSVCVLAAVHAKVQTFGIMDDSNIEDPISGKVMMRNYTSLKGLQAFSPATSRAHDDMGCVPLEVLIDYRCESSDFDRLVPQTDATFRYDKFNRLRLRNTVTSVTRASADQSSDNHLQNQTDLVQVHCPRFTVTANENHFGDISNLVTKLLLFSDPAHKRRLERLETLLFTYDFTDLTSAAKVVADLQQHLRKAIEVVRAAELKYREMGPQGTLEYLKLRAHVFLLLEELNYIFEAIKLAQDRMDDVTDQKSALLLHASSSEISWRMLDGERDLLAKLAVKGANYFWLSRQDSSTVNTLAVQDLQAFDGSPHAIWTEILSKDYEPANHPLCKRGLFIVADWTVLAPVGGISIYENFQLNLHPMRVQLDAKVGIRIMEYVWPARRERKKQLEDEARNASTASVAASSIPSTPTRGRHSIDSSTRTLHVPRKSLDSSKLQVPQAPGLRRLGTSRSFTDLRSSASDAAKMSRPQVHRTKSTSGHETPASDMSDTEVVVRRRRDTQKSKTRPGDAAEMKTRSSQKTFVYVKISSLHLLLSILKEESFECRDARIRTRDLEYRNETWSFEELVDQFIPSDMSWAGWVRMAFNQPLIPVLPVARELISKTKWITHKNANQGVDYNAPPRLARVKALPPVPSRSDRDGRGRAGAGSDAEDRDEPQGTHTPRRKSKLRKLVAGDGPASRSPRRSLWSKGPS